MVFETSAGKVTIDDSKRTKTEVYDRVTGYYRPISEFNAGKKTEQLERKRYGLMVD